MRKVHVFKWGHDDDRKPIRVHDYEAKFHQFTAETQTDNDFAPRLMAIVERGNGNVETVPYQLIQFMGDA